MLFLQFQLHHLRYDINRTVVVQTTSRMNRVIEKIWCETNQRFAYPLKEMLVDFELNSLFNLDDPVQKWIIGHVTRGLVSVGIRRFLLACNHHRIPGPCRSIPLQRARENCRIIPYTD